MLTADFDYVLPPDRIAQEPVEPRDSSRLLVLDRSSGAIQHSVFRNLLDYLHAGDLLVANITRVLPARMYAHKVPSGGQVELLLLSRLDDLRWRALVTGRRALPGQQLTIGEGPDALGAVVEEVTADGGRVIRFAAPPEPHLKRLGEMPLPPYIHTRLADQERYQTVYAQASGSAAAPTAGLHFTPELLAALQGADIEWAQVVLHIGLDTFRPVSAERVEDHQIHTEYCELDATAAAQLNRARREGRRIIAVGTTSVRVLETMAQQAEDEIAPFAGNTSLFIYPGYRFRLVDGLITNFHLPKSSLLMLVSAFAGVEHIRRAYATAIDSGYRFFSFGDSMLII
ncbi:MAG: tRNA preQ1(34) S-adenosylmethionine ribosyltransferase-isomerase QueA [Anaerolineae bacterium]|jgi:S-adenosylmethionine:tRNA ribosyltransferase-isomerase|nr:tRNA preQ1(34) S-adenosylmethionine ribosyltransferase-isomerase QueA [Chloroflexota bacterium]